ncbi:MAG: ATP-binding cassette domain-containing protein [Bacteroidota bacterium]|nr:ATP-binding cassette domain-containing protein [Bacteroidota bacterium]
MSLDTIVELRKAAIFQKEQLILSNVNLKVCKGDLIYLIGKVGSGKSSILKTLYAELPLKVGNGMVVGFDLNKIKQKKLPYLRRKLGIIFQDFQLLTDRNVFDNLQFVLKSTGWSKSKEIKDRINEVLEKVHLENKIFKMPHQLSGGEQQRVVIARALLNDPELILADEPTGNLDPDTSEGILQLLIEISHSGRAVVIATHDYPLIAKFPSTVYKCQDSALSEADVPLKDTEGEILDRFTVREKD